tara:strand:+ start:6484 stop:6726 length:243 start_codon:yes stop_codon:yes gene_type:complete
LGKIFLSLYKNKSRNITKKGVQMSNLLLKTQQELHKNNTKWNNVIEKIKKINFKKYDSNQTVGFIIDDIVKGEFIDEDKK